MLIGAFHFYAGNLSMITLLQEMLDEGRGITVPPFDCEALADAIISLLKNESLRREMGQRAKEHARLDYTWEGVARKTAQVYKEILKW